MNPLPPVTQMSGGGFGVFFLEDDNYFPSGEDNSLLVEYVLPMQRFTLIPNYFNCNNKNPESIDIEIEGRNIQVFGINEDQAIEEFEKALGGLVEPVVGQKDLGEVLDQYIANQVTLGFAKLHPSFSARSRMANFNLDGDLSDEEREELGREINLFDEFIVSPGEVRESLARLSSEKLKSRLIRAVDPVVTSIELQAAQAAIRIKKLRQPFNDLIHPHLRPKELIEELQKLPEELRKEFKSTIQTIEKRIEIFDTLVDFFSPLQIIKFVLGEELEKRLLKATLIKWKIPKENVPKLHQLIECEMKSLGERYSDPEKEEIEIAAQAQKAAEEEVRKRFQIFQKVQDYYIEDDVIPILIPLTKMPMGPWPRLESVKQALRVYFRFENILRYGNAEIFSFIEHLKKSLPEEGRARLVDDLGKASKADKIKILDKFNPPPLSEELKLVLIDAIIALLPIENEFLMASIEDILEPQDFYSDVIQLEQNARNTLDYLCSEAELLIVFRQNGKDVYLGANKGDPGDIRPYLEESDEEFDCVSVDSLYTTLRQVL